MADLASVSGTDDSRVCAVLVSYHPDAGLRGRLSRIEPQVAACVVVDNGSPPGALEPLRAAAAAGRLALQCNGANLGVASALNAGISLARRHGGCDAVLLLDQDTLADADLVAALQAVRREHPDPDRVAIVGAMFRDTGGRGVEPIRLARSGDSWHEVESVVTSGSLLSLAAYDALGPFREDFFIDHVDTEYCLRARAAGFQVVQTRRPLMAHTVGNPSAHRILGSAKWTTNHSADRRYYMVRNDTVMLRRYHAARSTHWLWKSLTRSVRLCKRIVLFETDKARKLAAVAEGWWHAVRGRMGPRRRP